MNQVLDVYLHDILAGKLQSFSQNIPNTANFLQKTLQQKGISSPIFKKIQDIIEKRAQRIINYYP